MTDTKTLKKALLSLWIFQGKEPPSDEHIEALARDHVVMAKAARYCGAMAELEAAEDGEYYLTSVDEAELAFDLAVNP